MADLDVPDLNVWLALADPDHQHHARAKCYWHQESLPEFAFCRVTMLGLLRLLTNSSIMAGKPFNPAGAWAVYEAFASLPETRFIEDSVSAEESFTRLTKAANFAAHRWTDAWIVAIAHSAGARVVSFDSDFLTFDGVRFLHLKA